MKKFRNLVIGGIENKLFNLVLVTVLLVSLAFAGITFYQGNMLKDLSNATNQQQSEAISRISSDLMDQVIEQSLGRTTELESILADQMFDSLKTRVKMLGEYAEKLLSGQENAPYASYAGPDLAKDGEVSMQVFLADDVRMDRQLDRRIGLMANMKDLMASLYEASELTNSCFVGLPEGAFLVTDDRSAEKFDENGDVKSYDPRTRFWYQMAVEEGDLIFTDVELDAFTGDVGIVCAMPVYVNGELAAVVGSDLFLSSMQNAIKASDENGGFLFVINRFGHVVFSPKEDGIFAVHDSSDAKDLRQNENRQLAELISKAMNEKTDVIKVDLDDSTYYMSGSPMQTVGWTLIAAFDAKVAEGPGDLLKTSYEQITEEAAATYRSRSASTNRNAILLILLIFALSCLSAIVLGRKIVRPLNKMTQKIAKLSDEDPEFRMEDEFVTGDEIEVLAKSFAEISHRTVMYLDEVKRVTAEKERISTELEMARRIQESMIPSIFPAFPERKEFDVYALMDPAKEVGGDFYDFFLIDQDHLGIVMADVSGKGVPAALFMMASKIIVQSYAQMGNSAAEILRKTNERICSNNEMQMFVTVWVGILEISTGKLIASNAGHEYPAIMRKNGGFELFKDPHGFVIGGMSGVMYKDYELNLEPGDKVFLYTDGVPEATDKDKKLFGTDRMIEALNEDPSVEPEKILGNVRKAVDAFVKDEEQFDDLTMLCLEYKGKK